MARDADARVRREYRMLFLLLIELRSRENGGLHLSRACG